MKMLVVLMSLITSVAYAEVKPFGTFVPSRCTTSDNGRICLGHRVGMKAQYISLEKSQSEYAVYKVVKTTPTNGGFNPQAKADVLDLVSTEGERGRATLRTLNYQPTSISIVLENGERFEGSRFTYVAVTL